MRFWGCGYCRVWGLSIFRISSLGRFGLWFLASFFVSFLGISRRSRLFGGGFFLGFDCVVRSFCLGVWAVDFYTGLLVRYRDSLFYFVVISV